MILARSIFVAKQKNDPPAVLVVCIAGTLDGTKVSNLFVTTESFPKFLHFIYKNRQNIRLF